jgi:hypothetical protein
MVALFICLLSACALPVKRDAYGRPVPRWPSWTLKTDNPDPEGLICYDCIYVSDYGSWNVDLGYAVDRYWESGHIMGKIVQNYENLEEINSKYGGGIGYYQVEGSKIIFESYVAGIGGYYAYAVGFFEEDGSILIVSSGLSLKEKGFFKCS